MNLSESIHGHQWVYSLDHGQLYQVIETQVWLPASASAVRSRSGQERIR